MQICPNCRYERKEHDAGVQPGLCPGCGSAHTSWLEVEATARGRQAQPVLEAFQVPVATVWQRFRYYICFMPSDGHIAAFWTHVLIYILLLIWGGAFMLHGVDWLWIGSSFLHQVNLPFHEYGHVMFSGFGEFWMFLGGSLFQILLPLFPLAYFMVWQRDNFAASTMLWWSGQNFIDVAPYIADAQLRAIPLITGREESHDWWNLLSMTGSLDFADHYASLCFTTGCCVMLLSYVWGGYLLSLEFRGRMHPDAGRTPP